MNRRPKSSVEIGELHSKVHSQLRFTIKQIKDENSSLQETINKLKEDNEELEEKVCKLMQLLHIEYKFSSERIELLKQEKEMISNESRRSLRKQFIIDFCLLLVLVLVIVWKNFK